MSIFKGVVHQALPARTRVLAREKLRDFLQIQKFDQLLAHQYCVRRLYLHHPVAFGELQSIRSAIEAVLAETLLNNEQRLFFGRKITATARCMRLLDSRRVRALGTTSEKSKFRKLLEREIEPKPEEHISPILCYLSDAQRDKLSDILIDGCEAVEKNHIYLNFLDYYDPFALSNLVSGKTMLTHYLAAKKRLYSVRSWAEELDPHNHWLHTLEAELDDEMTGIVCESAFLAKRPPSNVGIFGHNQHHISIDGNELKNHLILAVPTDSTPSQIDAALREFRSALREAFTDTCGRYAKVGSEEFDNSLFMRNFGEREFLVRHTKQYRSRLYGLWIWDLVNARDCSGLTVSEAIDKIISEVELEYEETLYDYSSYKNYYDLAVHQIMPVPTEQSCNISARELDSYLTADMAVLGLRWPNAGYVSR